MPETFRLWQNFPNPFNPLTQIRFDLPKDSRVQLQVFDVSGQLVRELVSGNKAAGRYQALFDAAGLSSGVYFYRLSTEHYTATRRMLLIK